MMESLLFWTGWPIHLIWKLLHNDEDAIILIDYNPFPEEPPTAIRAELYQYEFAPLDQADGAVWNRTRIGSWLPPIRKDDRQVQKFVQGFASK